ncbi:hypothetical protein GCM10027275_36930 [Rhabdobacter roseus]|uniref:DoxX family protein n=1 Tax=Rhabdobacter roseus TaxID=1655419 RepID=A0A840U197_9BACT|nr:hypothetical protein [Rhabdobacter roseus]MBB5285900.1 hypothetical protein [Rhabdobacter roseus]
MAILDPNTDAVESAPVSSSAQPVSSDQPGSVSGYLPVWKNYQRVLFRIAFIFFVSMTLPNNVNWYKELFALDWLHLHYRDIYDVARFGSGLNFFGSRLFGSPLNGYATWVITLLFSVVAGFIWTAVDKFRKPEPKEYNLLYYWLRVIVRYRAGIGIIGFGFTKLLPTQLPYPSWGVLNTNFGDLTLQKIYWLSIGIVPWYEVFAGFVEILAGALLFFRATTFWGSVLLFGALADIVYVNFAYDGGVHVYSSYFVLFSAFLLIQYIPSLYNLLIRERYTVPYIYYPDLSQTWQRVMRISLKTATIAVFLVLLLYLQVVNFLYDPYKQPAIKGIPELRGNYQVSEFRINDQLIPYAPLDTVRWQQATFEKWTTLTFKVNKPVDLDLSNGGGSPMRDINRTFELTGVAGGQRVFYYEADTINQVLYLQDKNRGAANRESAFLAEGEGGGARSARNQNSGNRPNPENNSRANANERSGNTRREGGRRNAEGAARQGREQEANWIPKTALAIIGPEDPKIHPLGRSTRRTQGIERESRPGKRNRMVLSYTILNGGDRVVLSGIDEKKDSIRVVLDRYDKKYALSRSTLEAGHYD